MASEQHKEDANGFRTHNEHHKNNPVKIMKPLTNASCENTIKQALNIFLDAVLKVSKATKYRLLDVNDHRHTQWGDEGGGFLCDPC